MFVIKGIQYYIVDNNKNINLRMGIDDEDDNKYPQYLDKRFDNLNTAVDRRNIIIDDD